MLAFAKLSAQTRVNQPPSGVQPPSTPTEHQTDEQWTEESLKVLKKDELKAILQGLGLKKSGNKDELIDRILGREVVAEENKKKPKWKNSKARAMLVTMLMDKHSHVHKMTYMEIHASHKWFQEYDPKLFQRYVRVMVKCVDSINIFFHTYIETNLSWPKLVCKYKSRGILLIVLLNIISHFSLRIDDPSEVAW